MKWDDLQWLLSPEPYTGYTGEDIGEAAKSMGSSMLMSAGGGLAAIPVALGGDIDGAAELIRRTQEKAYKPKARGGDALQDIANSWPMQQLEKGTEYAGNRLASFGGIHSPEMAATGYAVGKATPEIFGAALGLPGISRGASKFTNLMDEAFKNPVSSKGMGGKQRGMIAGQGAKNADLTKLEDAKAMKTAGTEPDTIYAETGWWLDHPDGQPRFEIDDKDARFGAVDGGGFDMGHVGQFLSHEKLYNSYPNIANTNILIEPDGSGGSYAPLADVMEIQGAKNGGEPELRSTGLHESQHIVQGNEGFSRGGSSGEFKEDLVARKGFADFNVQEANKELSVIGKALDTLQDQRHKYRDLEWTAKVDKQIEALRRRYSDLMNKKLSNTNDMLMDVREEAFKRYEKLGGESEARLTQDRMDMSMDERLANPFYKNYDVPFDDMILRSDSNGPSMSVSGGLLDPEDVARRAANRLKREQAKKLRDEQKAVEATAKAEREKLLNNAIAQDVDDYKMSHKAPGREQGYSADNLSGVYPEDIYSPKGLQYYGSGKEYRSMDADTLSTLNNLRGMPDAEVDIFRAAPKGTQINPNDWVTLSREYAQKHGDAYLDDYDILTQKAKASDLFTSGDSLQEWGWSPEALAAIGVSIPMFLAMSDEEKRNLKGAIQ